MCLMRRRLGRSCDQNKSYKCGTTLCGSKELSRSTRSLCGWPTTTDYLLERDWPHGVSPFLLAAPFATQRLKQETISSSLASTATTYGPKSSPDVVLLIRVSQTGRSYPHGFELHTPGGCCCCGSWFLKRSYSTYGSKEII